MNPTLYKSIVSGDAGIYITVKASDLRDIIDDIVSRIQSRVFEAEYRSRQMATVTRAEAARLLKVHPNTLDRWAKTGALPRTKSGVRVLYKMCDIQEMLSNYI